MPSSLHRGVRRLIRRREAMLVGPVHQEEVWTRSSQREPARSNIHASTTALRHTSGRSITIPGAIICPDFRAPRRNAASPSDQEIDEEAHFYCKMLGRRIDSIQ